MRDHGALNVTTKSFPTSLCSYSPKVCVLLMWQAVKLSPASWQLYTASQKLLIFYNLKKPAPIFIFFPAIS